MILGMFIGSGVFLLVLFLIWYRRWILNDTVQHLQCPRCHYFRRLDIMDSAYHLKHRFVGQIGTDTVVQCGKCLQTFTLAAVQPEPREKDD